MSEFLTIDENSIPEGGDNFGPLPEGPYEATCVAMVKGIGTKYQSDETEHKVRLVFAIQGEDRVEYIRSNWMKVSLWDGEPNPSTLWTLLSAWTNQKTAEKLIEKMGKFDLKFFLGKPITLGIKIRKDGKWNVISDYYAPKKGQAVIGNAEIPAFCVAGDKHVTDGIAYVLAEGATVKEAKQKKDEAPTKTSKKAPAKEPV
jgi:hypothetical protein